MKRTSDVPRIPGTAPRWTVGDVVVHRIDEIILPPEAGPRLVPAATPEVLAEAPWLTPDFAHPSGYPHLSAHSFAVRAGSVRVVIDTGIGNFKKRSNPAWDNLDTPYLERLNAAGYPPESVDFVINTHLHTDHVGWNTYRDENGDWVPTFPNARYLVPEKEARYWSGIDMPESRRQIFADSVQPIHDRGLVDLIDVPEDGAEVIPGIRLMPAPGHTPGQVTVHIAGPGGSAVVSADCIHHPVQLSHPHVTSSADFDPAESARSRAGLLAEIADTSTLLLGTHFPPPTAGLVRRAGDAYTLIPVPGEV